ncbi:MAG: (deoxy)nucleoside triphosphate pyrophosphohydrolase [Saprospiraceae bacterium]|uniref:8-oxo-dGTP diphosphatase n=1 Tax=Candidatus Opimibacter skivensis TaxID=2982028 RepID=A0A9D7SVT2_9BACT|nr:(deoxy)nucleoside triphosphate pyrophosphohydrolase [Candidatus Opimibacter skivensis]
MKSIKVVCGIIWKDGKILIAKRKPEKTLGGYWEFPGGKLELNEDPVAALQRELQEEMGMTVSNIKYFGSNIHEYDNFNIELLAFECDFESATFHLTDHDEYVFVPPHEFSNYIIAPADEYFVLKLIVSSN